MFHVKHSKNIRSVATTYRLIKYFMAMANRMVNAIEWREVLGGCMRRFGRWPASLASDHP
jgi:hypothetical protein